MIRSVSTVTDANRLVRSKQEFTPWGEIRRSGIQETSLNYTGQRRDTTGLLYYHARYYDPTLGRFLSADSIVPGAPDGSMDGVALKPLTVDFHEPGFVQGIVKENGQRFWFQMSSEERQQASAPWGPANAQALNRYSYVQNNPIKYTDPTGHHQTNPQPYYEQVCSNGGRDCEYNAQGNALWKVCLTHNECEYVWGGSDLFNHFKGAVDSWYDHSRNAAITLALSTTPAALVLFAGACATGLGCIVAFAAFAGLLATTGFQANWAENSRKEAIQRFYAIRKWKKQLTKPNRSSRSYPSASRNYSRRAS